MKKALALILALAMVFALCACGQSAAPAASSDNAGSTESAPAAEAAPAPAADKGKILYLSNLTSGPAYDFYVGYLTMICNNLGYKFEVVYGDMFNDPAANLAAVKNAYTSDVVGLIACQDGGLGSIMEEYPDLYVVGVLSDMDSVFGENPVNAAVLQNDHFLGNVSDGLVDPVEQARGYFDEVVARGYKKVSVMNFPVYAYPKQTAITANFLQMVEEYNKTASEPIEVVGEPVVLQFSPLEDSYFMEKENQELDAIVGICAGTTFIYPTMLAAKANGSINPNMQLITGGFENDPDLLADCGDDKTIVYLSISTVESVLWPVAMLDAALSGTMYPDFTGPEIINPGLCVINSTEEFEAMANNSPIGLTVDINKAQVQWDDMKDLFISVNPDATYAGLCSFVQALAVDGYMN